MRADVNKKFRRQFCAKKRSLGVNAVLNVIRSCLSIFFPLITYPYAFRILHAENIGKIDFCNSIISYFSFIAVLGISSYAIREGARIRDDKDKVEILARELFSINVFSTVIAYISLILFVLILPKLNSYSELIFLLSISVLFSTLGVEWVNTIYEDYFFIAVRSIGIHLISLVLLFLFVKNEADYYIYAFICVVPNILTGVSNWIYCKRYLKIRFTLKLNLSKHLKQILILFANTLATNIYVSSGTLLLGWITSDYHVGLLGIAIRIYNVIKNVVASVYAVVIPRVSFYIGLNDIKKLREMFSKLVSSVLLILLPASIGIWSIAEEIVLLMGGEEYAPSVITLKIFCFSLVGAILGGIFTSCFNIPMRKEKVNFQATAISALCNVCINFMLIPELKHNGVAVAAAFSEWLVFFYCLFKCKNIRYYIDLKYCLTNFFHSVIGAGTVVIVSYIVHVFNYNLILTISLIIILSVVLYVIELILLQNKLLFSAVKSLSPSR